MGAIRINGFVLLPLPIPHSGTGCARINYGPTAHNDWLITPVQAITATQKILKFWAKNYSTVYPEQFHLRLSTTTADTTAFTVYLQTGTTPPTTWTEYAVDLSAYVGQNVYIGFQAISADMYYLFLDDVTLLDIPPIPILGVSPTTKNYGDVYQFQSVSQIFTISNAQGGTLNVNTISVTGTDAADFVLTNTNSMPLSIVPPATKTVTVAFRPNTVGAKTAILRVNDGTDHDYTLSGNVLATPGWLAPTNISATKYDVYNVALTWENRLM